MATETPTRESGRPRSWLLIILGLAAVALVASRMFSGEGAAGTVPTPAAAPAQARDHAGGALAPSELDVKLEALARPAPPTGDSERNPFRFRPPPPPPPPPAPPPPAPTTAAPAAPPGPPPPPPITIKFIGVVETAAGRVGAFTDCKATFPGREGEIIEGRYRVVRIGIESAILEYRDGRGRTTLPLNGQAQACIGK